MLQIAVCLTENIIFQPITQLTITPRIKYYVNLYIVFPYYYLNIEHNFPKTLQSEQISSLKIIHINYLL